MIYFILGLVIFILIVLMAIYFNKCEVWKNSNAKLQEHIDNQRQKYSDTLNILKERDISQAINRSILAMDETHDTYANEDEANRELTTCLKLLGHDAKYHYPLDNGRTADVLVDNYALIEGKLDPSQSDIDRLIGQLEDYVSYPFRVYVVIYGYIVPAFVERIQRQILPKYFNKVGLIYLENPQRTRNNKILLTQNS